SLAVIDPAGVTPKGNLKPLVAIVLCYSEHDTKSCCFAVTVEFIGIPSPSQVSILSPSKRTSAPPILTKELPDVALGFPVPIESVMLNDAGIGSGVGGTKFLPMGPECFPEGRASSPGFNELLLLFNATELPSIL